MSSPPPRISRRSRARSAATRSRSTALAKGYQDPHFVDPKPSFILAVSRADLLDRGRPRARDRLAATALTSSRNAQDPAGRQGLSRRVAQRPAFSRFRPARSRAPWATCIPLGNPHYWLDPGNGRRIAQAIRDKLGELRPANAAYFAQRYADFDKRLAAAEKRWDATMAPYKGTKLVTYHRSWPNFMERFGLEVMGYVEPKPGIPPSPSHTLELIDEMKRRA